MNSTAGLIPEKVGAPLFLDSPIMRVARHGNCPCGDADKLLGEIPFQQNKPFGVVILDLTIPGGMGGTEVAGHILKMDPKARLIVASGYATDPVMENHQAYGFCAMLRKPYTLGDRSQTLLDVMARD